ncbi:MAG TPA: hypothetical protein VFT29_03060 [Gemmatimonadaceae bacterium]|nr:hypothetical protein [Gemmatimonadaceae bacterium]
MSVRSTFQGFLSTITPKAWSSTSANGAGRPVTINPPLVPLEEEAADGSGVHDVLKKTNFWFNRELYQLEQEALRQGGEWAMKGVPHPSVKRDEPLPVEKVLIARSRETYRQWIERVRTKMQDAIETAAQDVALKMVALGFATRTLEATQLDLAVKQRAAVDMREQLRERAIPFGYKPFIRKRWGIPILALLVLVEFVANFPVFRILLPMSAQLVDISERLTRGVIDYGLLTGAFHFLQDLSLRPEAVAVAGVVVLSTVVVADMFGISLRPLVALSAKDNPGAAVGIKRHKRQHIARVLLALTGVVVIISALYRARGELPQTAMARVATDSARVAMIDAQLRSAVQQGSPAVGALTLRLRDAERVLQLRRDEAAYAETVQRSNFAILLLNVAIAFAAACVGFSKTQENLMDELTEDPRYVELKAEIMRLTREAVEQRQLAREAIGNARAGISTVRHLQAARPLDDWPAKQERLQAAIQMFRSENARLRMLDPGDIAAFQLSAHIDFPEVPHEPLRVPAGFENRELELQVLSADFERVSKRLAADLERAASEAAPATPATAATTMSAKTGSAPATAATDATMPSELTTVAEGTAPSRAPGASEAAA